MTSTSVDPLAKVRGDFRNFLFAMWRYLRLPPPTEIQYDIGVYLQRGPRRRMVQAFRGVGKSWITAAYVLWRLLKNPNERILVVSASKERADAFSVFLKRLISEWDVLESLRPEPGMRDSNVAFDVGGSMPHQSPSVRSVGITGQMTGGRASVIVADDVETPKNALTAVMREKLAEAVKEFDAVLMTEEDLKALGMESADVVYLGTPQTEMSLYNSLPERGYEVRIWPSRYPSKPEKYMNRLAPIIAGRLHENPSLVGSPTDPSRFTHTDLLDREASYGRSGFALQFQLDTSLSDENRHPLRCSDLMVMGLSPTMGPVKVAWGTSPEYIESQLPMVGLQGDRWYRPMFVHKDYVEYQGVVMAIDPSGRGADETGYAVVAMCNGILYVLAAGGLPGGYDEETLEALALLARRYGVTDVVIESNFGDGMFTRLLAPYLARIHPVTTEEVRHSIQKEKRIIDTLEPVMNQHRLVFDAQVVEKDAATEDVKYQLFHQLTRITKDKGALAKDDRLDALAMAVARWVEVLDKDVRSIEAEHKEAMLKQEMERFIEHALGAAPAADNWMGSLNAGMLR